MSVRTYNPSVRVGNWNEDIQLEEDTLKDFLEKRESGQLLCQKSQRLKNAVLQTINLSISRDGKVRFGDTVMLVNPAPKDNSRSERAISVHIDNQTYLTVGSKHVQPCARTGFVITSCDGTPVGSPLKYGQRFNLCTVDGNGQPKCYLFSDRATFFNCAKKSRHNEVKLVHESSHLTEWKVVAFNPQFRMELEFSDVPANENIILVHVKTNEALHLETDYEIGTPFGSENEMTAFTNLDSHKAEKDSNHIQIVMHVPGDTNMPVEVPPSNGQ